jgi:hypothetical protein
MGRSVELAPPYNAYHSMFDAVLTWLPAREAVVRIAAFSLTAAAAPLLFALMMVLAFEWIGEGQERRWPIVAVLLLAVPELFYLGMVITPSVVAMCVAVSAHLLARRASRRTGGWSWSGHAVSAVLFGIGASIRWDTVLYGATVTADLFCTMPSRSRRSGLTARMAVPIAWGALALAAWLMAIFVSGYGPAAVLRIVTSNGPTQPLRWMESLANAQSLFTPALVMVGIAGGMVLWRKRHPLLWIALLALVAPGKVLLFGRPEVAHHRDACDACRGSCGGLCHVAAPGRAIDVGGACRSAVDDWYSDDARRFGVGTWFLRERYDAVAKATTLPRPLIGAGTAVPTPEGAASHCTATGGC